VREAVSNSHKRNQVSVCLLVDKRGEIGEFDLDAIGAKWPGSFRAEQPLLISVYFGYVRAYSFGKMVFNHCAAYDRCRPVALAIKTVEGVKGLTKKMCLPQGECLGD
jgi:hypothetical protein